MGQRFYLSYSAAEINALPVPPWKKAVLGALQKGDSAALANLPEDRFQSGTSETKNWITVAGAMAEAGLPMRLVDYVPCYRSVAGTGSAMGFARWC